MFKNIFCALTLFACIGGIDTQPLLAQEPDEPAASAAAPAADPQAASRTDKGLISLTKVAPDLTLTSDYSGDIWHRSTAFGDVLDERQKLYEKGITIDVRLTQVYQGIARGGPKDGPSAQSNGLVDYGMTFDTGKLGWWSGGLIVLNAETSYGNNIVGKTGTLSPVNYPALWPEAGKNSTFLMDYYLMQALPLKTVLMIGRLNSVEFLDRNKFANSPRNQFLNLSMDNDPLMGAFVSFSTYGVMTHTQVSKNFGFNLAVGDALIQPGDWTGHDSGGFFRTQITAVDMQYHWDIVGNRGGDVDFTWLWTNNGPTDFDNPRLPVAFVTGQPLPFKTTNNLLAVNIQQYLSKPGGASGPSKSKYVQSAEYDYQERGLGLFYRIGWVPSDRNPYNLYMSGGVGGRGVVGGRPYDRFGLGVYWLKESSALDRLEGNLLGNEVGFEAFYNVALTPWMNLTGDLQWTDSAIRGTRNPLILGTRLSFMF